MSDPDPNDERLPGQGPPPMPWHKEVKERKRSTHFYGKLALVYGTLLAILLIVVWVLFFEP